MNGQTEPPTGFLFWNEMSVSTLLVLEPTYDETTLGPGGKLRFSAWPKPKNTIVVVLDEATDGRVRVTLYAEHDGTFHPDEKQRAKLVEPQGKSIQRQLEPGLGANADDKLPVRVSVKNRMRQPMTLWIEPYCSEVQLAKDLEISFRASLFSGLRRKDSKEKDLEILLGHRHDELWLTLWLFDVEDELMFAEIAPTPIAPNSDL